jgi:hypothetical protein
MSNSLALLGDSIFDNSAYTGGDPDVVTHLRGFLPPGWVASLLAIDGSITTDLQAQLERVGDESHLIISVGGNDAIMNSDLLGLPVSSTAEALLIFGERMSYFESAYRAAIDAALILRRQTTVCTIYNADLSAAEAPFARMGLMLFNDVILRTAFERRLAVIDLRLVCTDPADYANQIEPSGRGGRKIAEAIARSLGILDGTAGGSRVYAG